MCFNRYILRRHGCGDFLIPSLKGITFSCRVGGSGNIRAVVLRNRSNLTSAVGIKGYCILIDFPLCFNRYILRRHGCGDFLIPSLKGITFSCRVGGSGNIRAVVLRNRSDLAAACGVKGDCVPIDFPLCFNRHILRRHSFGDFLIPTLKGISFSCRVGRSGNWCAVILRYGNIRFAVFGFDCDGILIDLPLRPIFLIARFCTADCRNRRAGQIFVVIPALERISRIGHIVGCRKCCTHAVGVFGDIAVVDRAAVCVQGYGIGRGCPLHRQFRHISRNAVAGFVGFAIAVKPHEVAACISVRAGQTVGRRRGKLAAGFHDDLNILGAITQLAAAKVKGNDLQSVRTQCARVQDFKDGAETEVDVPKRGRGVIPEAGRVVPTVRPERLGGRRSILSPRIHFIPVLDISAVLVQHRVPFVALGHAALGIARTCRDTSHRRCAQGIVHAAAGIIFAENQTFVIQATPANRMRYGIVRHKQAVGIFVLLCILLGGCRRRREFVGFYRSHIGKGNIVQRRIRQRNRTI